MQYPFIPFFLCLDEMNLAPVEEYFAEFLSAIESRSCVNKEYFTDPLIKPCNSFGENVCNEMIRTFFPEYNPDKKDNENEYLIDRLKNQGLMLPQNLIVFRRTLSLSAQSIWTKRHSRSREKCWTVR